MLLLLPLSPRTVKALQMRAIYIGATQYKSGTYICPSQNSSVSLNCNSFWKLSFCKNTDLIFFDNCIVRWVFGGLALCIGGSELLNPTLVTWCQLYNKSIFAKQYFCETAFLRNSIFARVFNGGSEPNLTLLLHDMPTILNGVSASRPTFKALVCIYFGQQQKLWQNKFAFWSYFVLFFLRSEGTFAKTVLCKISTFLRCTKMWKRQDVAARYPPQGKRNFPGVQKL